MSDEDQTRPLEDGEEPTEPIPVGGEDATESLPDGAEAPTDRLDAGDEAATDRLDAGDEAPTEPRESWAPHQPEVKSGTGILVASIVTSLALIIAYIFAGGFDFKPTPVADPCDSRVWTDPSGIEDTAQQLALSAVDGAACELGVSREQLTRALADDQALSDFLAEEDISREQFEQAVKSGLERAVDDAENAGAIDPLVATGIRTAIGFLPVDQIIPLLQNASGLIDGGSQLNELLQGEINLDDLLGGDFDLGELFGGGSGGSDGGSGGDSNGGSGGGLGDLLPDNLPQSLEDLRDQLPPEIEGNLPEGIEDDIGQQLQDQLDNLLGG